MNFELRGEGEAAVAILMDENLALREPGDFLDLMSEAPARSIVVLESQLHPDFFRLKTRVAGEALQKLTNYGIRLGVVGDFSRYMSGPLQDFMRESTRTGQVVFAPTLGAALARLHAPIRP